MQYEITNLRRGVTGEPFGFYYKVHTVEKKRPHELYLYANRFEITPAGVLILFDKNDKPYRSFAPGVWSQIAAASCVDGDEMYEEHDYQFEEVKQ